MFTDFWEYMFHLLSQISVVNTDIPKMAFSISFADSFERPKYQGIEVKEPAENDFVGLEY